MKTFGDIKINEVFYHNGTRWLKRSSRTAKVHDRPCTKTQPIFYFSKTETLHKGDISHEDNSIQNYTN